MEGIPGWFFFAIFALYGLMGLSVVPALAAVGFLLARRPRQALRLFAAALLCEAVVWAAFCFLLTFSLSVGLTSLSLLLAGSGQFVAALRSLRTYAVALGFATGAVLVIMAGTPILSYRLGLPSQWEWTGMPVALTSLSLAVTCFMIAVLGPFGSRQTEAEGAEAKGPSRTIQ